MAITIIHKKQNNKNEQEKNKIEEQQQYRVDTELMLRKLFKLCDKIIDYSNDLMDAVNQQRFIKKDDFETFETKKQKIEQTMEIFCLIMGQKYGLLEAVAKATAIIQKIQKIAESLGIDLKTTPQTTNEVETALDEITIQEMALLVRNLGIEAVCEKYNRRVQEYEEQAGLYKEGQDDDNDENNVMEYDVEKEEQDFKDGIDKCIQEHDGEVVVIDDD